MDEVMLLVRASTMAELLRAVIGLGGIAFSVWALVDDLVDRWNVTRHGRVGGPRWITATGHLYFNASLLVGWACFTGVALISIYLPERTNAREIAWTDLAQWLSLAFAGCVMAAQAHQRIARTLLRRLPTEAWAQMFRDMFEIHEPPTACPDCQKEDR